MQSQTFAIELADRLLPLGIALLSFDVKQSKVNIDVQDVGEAIQYLRQTRGVRQIGLWGRSKGAVVALRASEQDPSLAGLVCDSAYADILTVLKVPRWALSPISQLSKLSQRVFSGGNKRQRGGRKDNEADLPTDVASRCYVPAFFIHGALDASVPSSYSQDLRDMYAGDKQLMLIADGDHTSRRPPTCLARAVLFLARAFRRSESAALAHIEAEAAGLQNKSNIFSEEVERLLHDTCRTQRNRGLFLAALRRCPSHMSANHEEVPLPSVRAGSVRDIAVKGFVVFPSEDSEVLATLVSSPNLEEAGGAVLFILMSPTLVTLTLVVFQADEQCDRDGASIIGRMDVVAMVEMDLKVCSSYQHLVALNLRADGSVIVTIDAKQVAAPRGTLLHDGNAGLWRANFGNGPTLHLAAQAKGPRRLVQPSLRTRSRRPQQEELVQGRAVQDAAISRGDLDCAARQQPPSSGSGPALCVVFEDLDGSTALDAAPPVISHSALRSKTLSSIWSNQSVFTLPEVQSGLQPQRHPDLESIDSLVLSSAGTMSESALGNGEGSDKWIQVRVEQDMLTTLGEKGTLEGSLSDGCPTWLPDEGSRLGQDDTHILGRDEEGVYPFRLPVLVRQACHTWPEDLYKDGKLGFAGHQTWANPGAVVI